MIKRPTWIMIIVLALLAALAYYLQTVPDNVIKQAFDAGKTPTAGVSSTTLISPVDGLVKGIEITSADGHSVVIKHELAAGWILSIDAQTPIPADQSAAEQAASQAQGLRLTSSEIKPTTADLSGFGLDKPLYIYKVTLESGKILTFKIGKATIMDDGYYLQKEDGTIAVVDKYGMDALLNLLKQPPSLTTATPSPAPATVTPTGTITPTPVAPAATGTATPGS